MAFFVSTNSHADFSDNFDDGVIDSSLWSITELGGATIQETGGRLLMNLPKNPTIWNNGGSYWSFMAYLESKFTVHGDFDMQVDYAFITPWPWYNGTRQALIAQGINTTQRVSNWDGEFYWSDVNRTSGTSELSGKLRLTRETSGTTTWNRGYYWNGTGWTLIKESSILPASDFQVRLQTWNYLWDGTAKQIAFDNFQLTTEHVVPIPAPFWLLAPGLVGLIGLKRKYFR
jgi:hypothetical protein